MNISQPQFVTASVPIGRTLLLGAFAFSLFRSLKGESDLAEAFEGLVVGLLAITFFSPACDMVVYLSDLLSKFIDGFGNDQDLRALIAESFKKAAEEPVNGSPVSINIPAILEQAWRTGVWGIMGLVVDWVFLLAAFLLECAQKVLWILLLFFIPISGGLFPAFPKLLTSAALYAIEISLWLPVLKLINIATSSVARDMMQKAGSWGLYIVAIELLAIILTLRVPNITHRLLRGALEGDLGTHSELWNYYKRSASFGRFRGES
ncbi:hypothetical protein K2X30_13130 [bacterium]|nr:hypothetical protein [bacterium]